MEVTRGDIVLAALPGDYGKVRPVLVIQDDAFRAAPSLTVLPLTSDLVDFPMIRIDVTATRENGLRFASQIMVDKAGTVRRDKVGRQVGSLDPATMKAADTALKRFLGLN